VGRFFAEMPAPARPYDENTSQWWMEDPMKTELATRVGADAVLTLAVPIGQNGANKTVRVIVETVDERPARPAMTRAEWADFVQRMAGRIVDPTFGRQPQGDSKA
jgi:hypothetical protein